MGIKILQFILILFLFYGFLIWSVSLNSKINKLTLDLENSKSELATLNNQLKESNALIGEIDSSLTLPE